MPELPDIEVYAECLRVRLVGRKLEGIRLANPFLLRSVTPPLADLTDRRVSAVSRLGKRLVFELEENYFLVLHLMIAGRLRWKARASSDPPAAIPKRAGLAAFDFAHGTLLLTEAGSKRRASLYAVQGRRALAQHDPGGIEVLDSSFKRFQQALTSTNHTLKRALTDPHILSGIGNAYSDEILHRAQLSPFKQTTKLAEGDFRRLYDACRSVLTEWTERLRSEVGDGFPKKVTAFHPQMAVHGRHRQPCPVCDSPVQRLVYANNEANYCPTCQTGGKVLADRALSRLLKDDWPRTLEELDERRQSLATPPEIERST